MRIVQPSSDHTTSSSLAPFYGRARRRRLWRALRRPLILGGSVLLVAVAALAAGWLWF